MTDAERIADLEDKLKEAWLIRDENGALHELLDMADARIRELEADLSAVTHRRDLMW